MNSKDYLLTTKKSGQVANNLCDQFVTPKFRRRRSSFRRRRRLFLMHMF